MLKTLPATGLPAGLGFRRRGAMRQQLQIAMIVTLPQIQPPTSGGYRFETLFQRRKGQLHPCPCLRILG